ncbi:MAG: M20 family metallopeptidase [Clostridiales bacterium]|nr:M20 family metallopeptidase [Clostridiales bacterium]
MQDFNQFIGHLSNLISFESILSEPKKDAPFGINIRNCLDWFLGLAKEFGFETINYDGYAGEVYFGKGEEVGIIGHLDVVPIGIGWNSNPFTLTHRDGVYYGRGVCDDKTPLLSCLYALKELKNSKLPVNKKFRLIVGCDEESGWRDIEYLKTKTTLPEYGFSPDGDFPISYAEKGIVEVAFCLPKLKNFADVKGGTALNAVCDYVTVRPLIKPNQKDLDKFNLSINEQGYIVSKGKSAHGSSPHLGINAMVKLFEYLLYMGEDVKGVLDNLFYDKKGIFALKNEQGVVTLSPDLISEDEKGITITCDLRIPAPFTLEDVKPILDSFRLPYTTKVRHDPMMAEKNGKFVQTLLNAYNEITGEKAEPISMGGSTFARAFAKGCAFGPKLKGHIDNIHDANENVSKEQILTAYKIYKKAIFDLAK